MDILIPDSWLREFVKTNATEKDIERFVPLGGASINKVEKTNSDLVYHAEITSNRVDAAGVFGFAREVSAILPQFGKKAELKIPSYKTRSKFVNKVSYLSAIVDHKLCSRFTAVLINNVQIKKSPEYIQNRLQNIGLRPINNVVDISNYIMHELGQPVHTFDYDKIIDHKMILRASKKGEKLTTLDGKEHLLPGGDIVIEDGSGRLIDLAGIMGGLNSAVDEKTKNVLLFVQTYNPASIRKTSMILSQRSEAASLFEKGLDPELVEMGIKRGIDLFEDLTGGKADKNILDIYPKPFRKKQINAKKIDIEKILGITLTKKEIYTTLTPLGFETKWQGDMFSTSIPSYRASDINIKEDIAEEVARIYGYHKLPSVLMKGDLPETPINSPFKFENKLKTILKGYGAIEIYGLSLVPKEATADPSLKLKNPLGEDASYLRTSLMWSLKRAAEDNKGEKDPFHLFEIANVYIPQRGNLPNEIMTLSGIFSNYSFRKAKGEIDALLDELNIKYEIKPVEKIHYKPSHLINYMQGKQILGELGVLENSDNVFYSFEVEILRKEQKDFKPYKPIPKYPPQIEDITLTLPTKTKVLDVINEISSTSSVSEVVLKDIYKDNYTFTVSYQNPNKTLTDKEVEEIRSQMIKSVSSKFGGQIK